MVKTEGTWCIRNRNLNQGSRHRLEEKFQFRVENLRLNMTQAQNRSACKGQFSRLQTIHTKRHGSITDNLIRCISL
jgi:hypothetical protein